ncbi:MAG: tetratricopeptide repeat protein [Pseudodesulfovibrio sp.]|uniref:tetratricopeptide repeat protein n=1 Tax=Pseudodesulfovibrio sp. TaxID=2035812 RepID=UPI003D13EE5B
MIRFLFPILALCLLAAGMYVAHAEESPMTVAELKQAEEAASKARRLQLCEQCDEIDDGPHEANLLARKGCKALFCTLSKSFGTYDKMMALQEEAARLGSPEANYILGWAYDEKDKDRSVGYFQKAAELGHTDAQTKFAKILLAKGDVAGSLYWLEKAVATGDAHASAIYGEYLFFTGVANKDLPTKEKGCALLLHAAKGGEWLLAQRFILVNAESFQKELPWFLEKANAGLPQYYCMAGAMYERGIGVTQDFRAARKWYEKAVRNGVTSCASSLYMLLDVGEKEQPGGE